MVLRVHGWSDGARPQGLRALQAQVVCGCCVSRVSVGMIVHGFGIRMPSKAAAFPVGVGRARFGRRHELAALFRASGLRGLQGNAANTSCIRKGSSIPNVRPHQPPSQAPHFTKENKL
eukprot:668666-Pelagomonas_calceolata.AAC.3